MTESAPLPNADQLLSKIGELKSSLELATPGYESLLFEIHQRLAKDEELVHLLKEEDIGIILAGLSKKKNVVIAAPAKSKSTTSSGKKLKDVTLGDI